MRYFIKFLNGRRSPLVEYEWPEPGVWAPPVERLQRCKSGYHLCRWIDTARWVEQDMWIAEADGDGIQGIIYCEDKVVVRSARLVERVEGWNAEVRLKLILSLFDDLRPTLETAFASAFGEDEGRELLRMNRDTLECAVDGMPIPSEFIPLPTYGRVRDVIFGPRELAAAFRFVVGAVNYVTDPECDQIGGFWNVMNAVKAIPLDQSDAGGCPLQWSMISDRMNELCGLNMDDFEVL